MKESAIDWDFNQADRDRVTEKFQVVSEVFH